MQIQIDLNDEELVREVMDANSLAEDHDEVVAVVKQFFEEVSTPAGLALILENLDYFNY